MDAELNRAKALLEDGGYTCVLLQGTQVHTSTQRGVKPLLDLLDQGADVRGFSAADKVVGKATALLYCLLGVRAVYAPVVSSAAAQVLEQHGIQLVCGEIAGFIWNRRRTGPCPMETAVRDIPDPETALAAVRETLKNMK